MTIHKEIVKAIAECECNKNYKPTAIYLGKSQMDRLMQWALENQYVMDTTKRTGMHRPEVQGIPVYEVNSDSHCVAA